MPANKANIFTAIPELITAELFNTLWQEKNVRIERIVSRGHSTTVNQWYQQAGDEWVLVICGQARLCYELNNQSIDLIAGDYILIPAQTKHRVEWTMPDTDTVWLAVHIT